MIKETVDEIITLFSIKKLEDNTGDTWNNSVFLFSIGILVGGSDDAE